MPFYDRKAFLVPLKVLFCIFILIFMVEGLYFDNCIYLIAYYTINQFHTKKVLAACFSFPS